MMPDWAGQLSQLLLAGLTAIGGAELVRQWLVHRLKRQEARGERLDSREQHDWLELDRFRLEQSQRITDLEARVTKQAVDCAQEIETLRDEHRLEMEAKDRETQEWRERYFTVAGELREALAERAARHGDG